ncbi:MAG: hypothetical protein U9R79_08715 [Armatimonadota bacterium]|nr:hypothetical protein [Armatimonadota bacterium]
MLESGEPAGDRRLVSGREVAWVIAWALLVVALTAAPYVWAIANAPPGQQFQGFIWGADDGNVYLSWIRQAAEGRRLLRNQYTTLPQSPHFFNIFLQTLGRVAALTGQPPAVIFHAARLAGGLVLLAAIYLLAAFITESVPARWAALCLASLGSGLGWAAALWAEMVPDHLPAPLQPPDFAPPPPQTWQVMPEAVTFLSLLLNPLFVWSMAFMCLVLLAAAAAMERRSLWWAALAGGLLLLLGNMHTYDVFVMHGTIAVYALALVAMKRLRLRDALVRYAIIFVIALPAPAWSWWAAHQDPAYLVKVETKTLSPPPLDFAAAYGLILLLALVGGWWAVRRREDNQRLLLPAAWAVVNAVLLYAPVSFQRKLAEGLHIPLCILAGMALVFVIGPRLTPTPEGDAEPEPGAAPVGARRRAAAGAAPSSSHLTLLVGLTVVLTLPSNALFVSGCLDNVATNNMELLHVLQPPIYLTFDEVRGIEFLAREAAPEEIVLSSSLTGSHIPARACCLVFAGHWAETLHFSDAVGFVTKLLLPGRSERVLCAAIEETGADYVFYGPREALVARRSMLAAGLRPPEDPAAEFRESTRGCLDEVFTRGDVSVYRFNPKRREPEEALTSQGLTVPPVPR